MVEKLLSGVPVMTGIDYRTFAKKYAGKYRKVIYTGPIDEYFDYRLGHLQYRTVRFETEELDMPNFQGNAVVGRESSSTNGSSSERIWRGMIFRRRLFPASTLQSGSRAWNPTTRSTTKPT